MLLDNGISTSCARASAHGRRTFANTLKYVSLRRAPTSAT